MELGRRTGMTSANISLLESVARNPPYLALLKIARALGKRTMMLIT